MCFISILLGCESNLIEYTISITITWLLRAPGNPRLLRK
jgi:hypothetical protein